MKKMMLVFLSSLSLLISFAQREIYDLVSYIPPAGWKSEAKANQITYTPTSNKINSWCQLSILKSTGSKGSIEADFKSEWQEIAIKNYHPNGEVRTSEIIEMDGWKTKTGFGKFIFKKEQALVTLTAYSGYDRCLSIVATTNSEEYLNTIDTLLSSVIFIRQESEKEPALPITNPESKVLAGTWRRGTSNTSNGGSYGRFHSTGYQYTFNSNGSYYYIIKTYGEDNSETLLTRETGTYRINADIVTLVPKTNVIEAWSKKNGGDNYNKLISSQAKPLEKASYRFTLYYFNDLKETDLVLLADTETMRDGKYNAGYEFPKGWRFTPSGPNYKPIKLPGD